MRFGVMTAAVVAGFVGAPIGAWGQIDVRVATYNLEFFDGSDPVKQDALTDVLARVNADVICVQEVQSPTALADLAADAGYSYSATATTNDAIDSSLFAGVISRYPILSAVTETSVTLSGDATASDLTRNFLVATIDVPEAAQDLVVVTNHWKADTGDDVEFRRSVESKRAMQAIAPFDGVTQPVILCGDMNDDILDAPDSPAQFFSEPGGLPASFELGNDIVFPVDNSVFKPLLDGVGASNLTSIDALQLDGQDGTSAAERRLDYLWISDAVTQIASEVYDSDDEDLGGGLPKNGTPLPAGTSAAASDHKLVFADVELLSLVTPTGACCLADQNCEEAVTVDECAALGGIYQGHDTFCSEADCSVAPPSAILINEIRIDQTGSDNDEYVEIAGPPGNSLDGLTYLVIGDGTGGSGVIEANFDLTGLVIPADGLLLVAESTFTLNGATPDAIRTLDFENSDNATHLLVEAFTGSSAQDLDTNNDGVLDVQPWSEVVDLIALIKEDNPPATTEFHYGPPTIGPDGAFVPGHVYRCPLEPGEWLIGPFEPVGGLDTPGVANPCPAPPTGACCADGVCSDGTADDCAIVGGAYQGDGSACATTQCPIPGTLAIHELDYDQPSIDTAEFIELSGTPGMTLSGWQLVLYNGNGGASYNTIDLSALGDLPIDGLLVVGAATVPNVDLVAWVADGIQNGAPDGMALVQDGVVVESLAYEGSFVAVGGPAGGQLLSDLGVADSDAGSISRCEDGTFIFSTEITPGLVNADCTPPAPTGACCMEAGCSDAMTESGCIAGGGLYNGDDSVCSPDLCVTPCEGDANGDGTVDPLDGGYVQARFGCAVGVGDAECDAADQNLDGGVDPLDYGFVLARLGLCN